jgi:hypothetical protein
MSNLYGGYMSEFGVLQWLVASTIFFVVPFWRIHKRAGFKPELALFALVPGGVLILLLVIAFVDWPVLTEKKALTEKR